MKKVLIVLALILTACNQQKDTTDSIEILDTISHEKDSNMDSRIHSKDLSVYKSLLIVAGQSVGETNLLDDAETLTKFGKASFSTAAMGKAWTVWTGDKIDITGNKSTLLVYTTYNGSDMSKKVVKKIRITSPDFRTQNGAHTGLSLSKITDLYSGIQFNSDWNNRGSKVITSFYTVKNEGIGFEFQSIKNSQICVAIVIASADDIDKTNYILLDSDEIPH